MPEIGSQFAPSRADHSATEHEFAKAAQENDAPNGAETTHETDAPNGAEATHENDAPNGAKVNVVDSKLRSSATEQVKDLWSRCDAPLIELKERVAKLPDSKSRKALEGELNACITKLDRAKEQVEIIAHRAAVARDPSGASADELMQMWREMKRLDVGVFTDVEKQVSRLAQAVENARMPAGPLKVSIVTLVATAVTMVAAALLSFAVPPLGIALIFGAGVLVGTASMGYQAAACWRSGDLPEDRLRGLHADVRAAIDGVLKTHESLMPKVTAVATPHLERHANSVAREACERLLPAAIARPVLRFNNNQDWRQPYPYLHKGEPVASEETISSAQNVCTYTDPYIHVLEKTLGCVAREELGRGTTGGINQAITGELAEKRLKMSRELRDIKADRDLALEPHLQAMEKDINTFILTESKGRNNTAVALDFLLSPAPQKMVCDALSQYLGARVGLAKDEPNPLRLYVHGDLAQTDVKVGEDGSVTACVTVAAHAAEDGGILIESDVHSAPVPAGEDLRAEARLRMADGKCTVESVTVTASDGVLDTAMQVYKFASLERLAEPALAVTEESKPRLPAETKVVDRAVSRPRSIRSTVVELPRPMPREVQPELRAAPESKRLATPALQAATPDMLAVEAAVSARAQLELFNTDYAKWDKASPQNVETAVHWAVKLSRTAAALKHQQANSNGEHEYGRLLGLLDGAGETAEPIGRMSSESQQAVEQALLEVNAALVQVRAYVVFLLESVNIGAGMGQRIPRSTNFTVRV